MLAKPRPAWISTDMPENSYPVRLSGSLLELAACHARGGWREITGKDLDEVCGVEVLADGGIDVFDAECL